MSKSICKCGHVKTNHLVGYGDLNGGVCWECYKTRSHLNTYGVNIVCGIFIKDNLRLLEILEAKKNGRASL